MKIRVREAGPADAAGIARVHVDTWRTTYPGILPADFLAGLRYANSEAVWSAAIAAERADASLHVAESDENEIVGFVYAAPERERNPDFRGEIFAIYVCQEFQGRGAGRKLFTAAVQSLHSAGFDSFLLWVLRDNQPARRFYESMGGKYLEEKTITIGDTELVEVSYGWQDSTALARGSV